MAKFIFLSVWIFSYSCSGGNKKIVLKKGEPSIEYEASRKYGNFLNVVKTISNSKVHYNLYITDDGRILHVLKYNEEYHGKTDVDFEALRSLQLLVTDTSRDTGPSFFGHTINGYYSDTFLVNNVITNRSSTILLAPLVKEEMQMFFLIDSLARVKNIKYVSFDTSKVLGWFKYKF